MRRTKRNDGAEGGGADAGMGEGARGSEEQTEGESWRDENNDILVVCIAAAGTVRRYPRVGGGYRWKIVETQRPTRGNASSRGEEEREERLLGPFCCSSRCIATGEDRLSSTLSSTLWTTVAG
ncbi:hypothetical protein KM043_014976 [Ampulex compressa]|nr:hypothetical protein KM043_014976 [Ampulex compressa]